MLVEIGSRSVFVNQVVGGRQSPAGEGLRMTSPELVAAEWRGVERAAWGVGVGIGRGAWGVGRGALKRNNSGQ